MNNDPRVLVAVPTLNRPHYLPRILACFKRQQYNNKQLIVINDDKNIKYKLEEEDTDITILNVDKLLNLSVKRNIFACFNFDIIMYLDDDDLYTPMRIANHVKIYKNNSYTEAVAGMTQYVLYDSVLAHEEKQHPMNFSCTRDAFFKIKGFEKFDTVNAEDIGFREKLLRLLKVHIDTKNTDWLYWWCNSSYHATYMEDPIFSDPTSSEEKEIELSVGYKQYDHIMELIKKVKQNQPGIKMELNEDGTNIYIKK